MSSTVSSSPESEEADDSSSASFALSFTAADAVPNFNFLAVGTKLSDQGRACPLSPPDSSAPPQNKKSLSLALHKQLVLSPNQSVSKSRSPSPPPPLSLDDKAVPSDRAVGGDGGSSRADPITASPAGEGSWLQVSPTDDSPHRVRGGGGDAANDKEPAKEQVCGGAKPATDAKGESLTPKDDLEGGEQVQGGPQRSGGGGGSSDSERPHADGGGADVSLSLSSSSSSSSSSQASQGSMLLCRDNLEISEEAESPADHDPDASSSSGATPDHDPDASSSSGASAQPQECEGGGGGSSSSLAASSSGGELPRADAPSSASSDTFAFAAVASAVPFSPAKPAAGFTFAMVTPLQRSSSLPASFSRPVTPEKLKQAEDRNRKNRPKLGSTAFLLRTVVAVVVLLFALFFTSRTRTLPTGSQPRERILIIATDEVLASELQFTIERLYPRPTTVDRFCPTSFVLTDYFSWYDFNCQLPTTDHSGKKLELRVAAQPFSKMKGKMLNHLLSYDTILIVESASADNLQRTPFGENHAVYDHIRTVNGGSLQLSTPNVRVVFTDVSCEAIARQVKHVNIKDCMASSAARDEAFEIFSLRVGVLGGGLSRESKYVDVPSELKMEDQMKIIFSKGADLQIARGRGEPLASESEFVDFLKAVKAKLKLRPSSLFGGAKTRKAIDKKYPRFQIGVIGLAGAGKSTTLRWLSFYAGLQESLRTSFSVAMSDSASHTRKLLSQGMAEDSNDAHFVVFDTMGLDKDTKMNAIKGDLSWLVEGRLSESCQMKWQVGPKPWFSGAGVCESPWNAPPSKDREFHAVLLITRYFEEGSKEHDDFKFWLKHLQVMLQRSRKDLVIGVTHLEECKELTTSACIRSFEQGLGLSRQSVVALGSTSWVPEYAKQHSLPGLHGGIPDEIKGTAGVYIEPDALLHIVDKLQLACSKLYDQDNRRQDSWEGGSGFYSKDLAWLFVVVLHTCLFWTVPLVAAVLIALVFTGVYSWFWSYAFFLCFPFLLLKVASSQPSRNEQRIRFSMHSEGRVPVGVFFASYHAQVEALWIISGVLAWQFLSRAVVGWVLSFGLRETVGNVAFGCTVLKIIHSWYLFREERGRAGDAKAAPRQL